MDKRLSLNVLTVGSSDLGRRSVPQEVIYGRQETLEVENLHHQPFHGHHFISAVRVASYAKILLPHTDICIATHKFSLASSFRQKKNSIQKEL